MCLIDSADLAQATSTATATACIHDCAAAALAPKVPTHIHDLNIEVLLHIATYLDHHDLTFGLAHTDRLFYAVSSNGKLWSHLTIRPCNLKELRFLAVKYPTIESIDLSHWSWMALRYIPELPTLLPNLRVCVDVDLSDWPVHNKVWLQKAHPNNQGEYKTTVMAAGAELRDLTLRVDERVAHVRSLSRQCSNLQRLSTEGFNMLSLCPTAFPQLTALHDTSSPRSPLSAATWTDFVNSHPSLTELYMYHTVADFTRGDPIPTQLQRLTLRWQNYQSANSQTLAEALVAGNRALTSLDVCMFTEGLLADLSTAGNLIELHIESFGQCSQESVAYFAHSVCLRKFHFTQMDRQSEDEYLELAAAFAPALAHLQELRVAGKRAEDTILASMGTAVCNLTSLTATAIPTADCITTLATSSHLRKLSLRVSSVCSPLDWASLAAGCGSLRFLQIDWCPADCVVLVAAAARTLDSLCLLDTTVMGDAALEAFVENTPARRVSVLKVSRVGPSGRQCLQDFYEGGGRVLRLGLFTLTDEKNVVLASTEIVAAREAVNRLELHSAV